MTSEFNGTRFARGTGPTPIQRPDRPAPTTVAELIHLVQRASAPTMQSTSAEKLLADAPRRAQAEIVEIEIEAEPPPVRPAPPRPAPPAFEVSPDVSNPRMAVDATELVKSNALFTRLARALKLKDDEARFYLQRTMADAGTRPDILSAEELWFMLPAIEKDVLCLFVNQDATIRREQLGELMRRVRYESINASRKSLEVARASGMFLGRGYARPA